MWESNYVALLGDKLILSLTQLPMPKENYITVLPLASQGGSFKQIVVVTKM